MQLIRLALGATALLVVANGKKCYVPEPADGTDLLAAQSLSNLRDAVADGSLQGKLAERGVSQTCTLENAVVRREYSTLTSTEKLAYTSAVKCLMAKPPRTPPEVAPGARSRYEDFVATHINSTQTIHFTGNFLSWHRYFVWAFETALRDECGYQGYLPYWNWGKSAQNPERSPYLDGSPTSQGGNGAYVAHNCTPALISGRGCIPAGHGGGCVETGPYAGMVANLSATGPTFPGIPAGLPPLSYQPRCVRRDISPWVSRQWSTEAQSVDLLTNPAYQTDIRAFQDRLQGGNVSTIFNSSFFGVHSAGHFTWGGDPGGDVANSPSDPMFWLHHAQIDRTWWIWQNQKPLERVFQIAGTQTLLNYPTSPDASIEDPLDLHYTASNSAVKFHLSSVGGPYCYIYK
ncbi:tyrosinase [Apiospora kogelbergensis]|uniref:tyrosinase n=1 Tax=Apiospora kogelbergensis TaxID=1337665 RepID=UPI00312CE204